MYNAWLSVDSSLATLLFDRDRYSVGISHGSPCPVFEKFCLECIGVTNSEPKIYLNLSKSTQIYIQFDHFYVDFQYKILYIVINLCHNGSMN